MPAVYQECETIRAAHAARALKEQHAQQEAADSLVSQCEECELPWTELPTGARERICRSIQLANGPRGYHGLADLLGVDDVDARFCSQQVAGHLKSPTELMLEDLERSRSLPAVDILRFLRDHSLMRTLGEVSCGVQEACARRRQASLLRQRSASSCSSGSTMESGYISSGSEIIGVVSEPPDQTLVQSTPVRSSPVPELDAKLKPPEGKKLMLTYASDGAETAFDVAERLQAVGFRVLLLENQRRWRQADPYTAVQKWFTQVDYVVPLLTSEYLAATQNRAQPADEHARRLAEDVRFVYSLMCAEMEKNAHVNWRVRALLRDEDKERVRDHPLYGSPLFRWPFQVSDLEELTECLAG